MMRLLRTGATPRGTLVSRGVRARRLGLLVAGIVGALWAPASAMATTSVSISGVPANADHPASFTATANESVDPGDQITGRTWTLNGAPYGGTGTSQAFTRLGPGDYTIKVTVDYTTPVVDQNSPDPANPIITQEARQTSGVATVKVGNNPPTATVNGGGFQAWGQTSAFNANGSSDPDGDGLTYAWSSTDGWTATGKFPPTRAFPPGTHTVTLTVTDDFGATATDTGRVVAEGAPNQRPTAVIAIEGPNPAGINKPVTFNATGSKDADGTVQQYWWDFGAGFVQGTARESRSWPTPGSKNVRLRVVDNLGAQSDIDLATVTVQTFQPPQAAFTFAPNLPQSGNTVTFVSTSQPGEAPITSLTWDLDNDGQFDDGSGTQVSRSFTQAGTYTVSLKASTARANDFSITSQPVIVSPIPGQSGGGSSSTGTGNPTTNNQFVPPVDNTTPVVIAQNGKPGVLTPFPIVRIRGRTSGSGVLVTLLSVTAPSGSTVKVTCKGRGCPKKKGVSAKTGVSYRQDVRKGKGAVRFKTLARKYYDGTTIEIYISKKGMVGKYTRFRIRKGKAPARRDACLTPGSSKPTTCPTG